MTETPDKPAYDSPAYAKAVEQKLEALKGRHRLAIHQWERYPDFSPDDVLDCLRRPENLRKNIAENPNNPLISMSLLPARDGMQPYEVATFRVSPPAYLFDLDEQKENPALVVRASVENACSGSVAEHKHTFFTDRLAEDPLLAKSLKTIPDKEPFHDPLFAPLYDAYDNQSAMAFREALSQDLSLQTRQLDILAGYMAKQLERPIHHNEILVTASKEHIAALTVPVFDSPEIHDQKQDSRAFFNDLHTSTRQLYREMMAALTGLDQLSRGIDVPVVFYQVDDPNAGKITYFGQGKDMLSQKALTAIKALQERGVLNAHHYWDNNLQYEIMADQALQHLGINVLTPLEQQRVYRNHPSTQVQDSDYRGLTNEKGPELDLS